CQVSAHPAGLPASDDPSANGAKSDYDETLSPPYDSKNGPFDTVEELLLVKGMIPSILYGSVSGNPVTADSLNQNTTTTGFGTANSSGRTRQAPAPGGASGTGGNTGGTGGQGGTTPTAQAGDTNWDDVYSSSTV